MNAAIVAYGDMRQDRQEAWRAARRDNRPLALWPEDVEVLADAILRLPYVGDVEVVTTPYYIYDRMDTPDGQPSFRVALVNTAPKGAGTVSRFGFVAAIEDLMALAPAGVGFAYAVALVYIGPKIVRVALYVQRRREVARGS